MTGGTRSTAPRRRCAGEQKPTNDGKSGCDVPLTDVLLTELRSFQRQLGALGGWLFADDHDPSKPMDRHTLRLCELSLEARVAPERRPGRVQVRAGRDLGGGDSRKLLDKR